MVYTECPATCGENCKNHRIQKHDWAPGIKRKMTPNKGYGVFTLEKISKGNFILEYVGEVVNEPVFKERMNTIYAGDTHHYCLHLDGGLVIDGHRAGGEGRFVNHSCEPNCEMQKWSVNGLSRMALFALRDIESNEELSYDYNFSLFNPSEGQVNQIFKVSFLELVPAECSINENVEYYFLIALFLWKRKVSRRDW